MTELKEEQLLPQIQDQQQFFAQKPARNEEEFWDNQALLPGYQGVVVDTENNLSTQMLYNFLTTQINFENEVILDMGCGVGRLFPIFINFQAKEIHGVDLSMNMIRVARFKYPQDNIYLYKLNAGDMGAITPSKASLIVSVSVLCHIMDDDLLNKVIAEMTRICAPNGVIMLCEPTSITANITHEHSMMRTRPLMQYKQLLINSCANLQELHCSRECFGPVDHIDSIRTILVYRKL